MPEGTQPADRMWFVPAASNLAPWTRAVAGRKMELYAAMVQNMDHHIGRLINYLKCVGEYDNTLFIFLSDNGPEGTDLGRNTAPRQLRTGSTIEQQHPPLKRLPKSLLRPRHKHSLPRTTRRK